MKNTDRITLRNHVVGLRIVWRNVGEAHLDAFMADLPCDFRYGIEIRNRNWLGPDFTALCKKHRAAMVLVDQAWMPHMDELDPEIEPVTTDFAYIRLLGDRREIEAVTKSWSREVLDRGDRLARWASCIAELGRRGVPALVYVNNHYAGHAPTTVERLRKLCLGSGSSEG